MQTCGSRAIRAAIAVLVALGIGAVTPASARPEYLVRFQADPMRRAEVNGCGTCHIKADGGGARNDFGAAFDAATRDITPLLRAAFPQYFAVESAKLPDGTTFYMSDPASKVVVLEREKQKVLVAIADIVAPKVAPLPPSATRMTFFVTSRGAERGGQLGGLAGADRVCQELAAAAGAGDRPWRAYLSTTFRKAPAVNAGDRIGRGPWHNAAGALVARGPIDLHQKAGLAPALFLTETGTPVPASVPVYTGSLPSGIGAVDHTCDNWTSTSGEAAAGQPGGPWNAGRMAACAAGAAGGVATETPRLYCFSPG